jgi:L-iditol 2-dehydrogenase
MPETMMRMMLVGPSRMEPEQVPVPTPGTDDVLLKIHAVGVCGSDLKQFEGCMQPGAGFPLLLGHEFTGQIVECGRNVRGFAAGDFVACAPDRPCGACEWCRKGEANVCPNVRFCAALGVPGVLSEYYVANASQLYAIPAPLDPVHAVLFEPFAVGLHAVETLVRPTGGETYAVIGCGVVGLSMLAAARLNGAGRIFASDLTIERVQVASRLGADAVCHAATDDFERFILDHTDGRGVDVVLEAGGTPEATLQSFRLAAIHGHVVMEGIPHADLVPIDTAAARRRELQVHFGRRSTNMDARALDLMAGGAMSADHVKLGRWPLDQAQAAFECARDRLDGVIKAAVTP